MFSWSGNSHSYGVVGVLGKCGARGEAYCDACKGDSGWSGDKALDQIGNPNAGSGVRSHAGSEHRSKE